mgnify:CR=1 FL=1
MVDSSEKMKSEFNARRCPTCGRWYPSDAEVCARDQSPLRDPPSLRGALVAQRYQVIETIAQGGMGVVYLARQSMLDRLVALKVIAPIESEGTTQTQRFMDEARAVSRIRHPNIVTLFDFGHLDDGRLFMALEYVHGQSLAHRLADGPLTVRQSIEFGVQLAEALSEAHRLGIVHRDIKPDNVMLTEGPLGIQIRLLDFGIAHHLGRRAPKGATLGTAEYSAPEAFIGGSIDARADIYAFGVMLFEMLTGSRPYGGSPEMVARRHTGAPIPVIDGEDQRALPEGLNTYIARMMAKQPDDRPTSIDAVRDVLLEAQAVLREDRVTPAWGVQAVEIDESPEPIEFATPEAIKPRSTQNRWRESGSRSVRWSYIVLLGLVSAAAIGLGALQTAGDTDLGVPTDWRQAQTRRVQTTHTVALDPFVLMDERLIAGARGALVPAMIEDVGQQAGTLLPAPYLLLEGRDDGKPETMRLLTQRLKAQQLRVDNEAPGVGRIREQLSLISLQWDHANRAAQQDPGAGLNYTGAAETLADLLKTPRRIPARDAVLYYLAHAVRTSGDFERAAVYEQDLIDHYPQSEFALRAKVHLTHSALAKRKTPQARAILADLRRDTQEVGRVYAEFLDPFLTYADGRYGDALDQALAYIETAISAGPGRNVFQEGMVELLVLSGSRSAQGPLTVRGYLRGLGGVDYERRYLPLLAAGLVAAERWKMAIQVFKQILPLAPDPVRQATWSLDYARALAGLDGRHDTLSIIEDSLSDCETPFLPEQLRPQCQLIRARILIALGRDATALDALQAASLNPNLSFEIELRRADLKTAPFLREGVVIQQAADGLRAQLELYASLAENAPLHLQAVLFGRQAQLCSLFAGRLRALPRYKRAADTWQGMAQEAGTRGAAAWSSSKWGLDWYLSLGPIGWSHPEKK